MIALAFIVAGCGGEDSVAAGRRPDPAVQAQPDQNQPDQNDPDKASAAGTDASPSPADDTTPAVVPTPPNTPTPSPMPTPVVRPAAPNGRTAPAVATTATRLAYQVAAAESGLRDEATSAGERADWGHLHQVAIRAIGYRPEWDSEFFEALSPPLRATTLLHVSARRALVDLRSGYDSADFIPAWQIVEPESAEALLLHYREAEAATSIEWEYLAAINLVETGMGRIRGLSSAGAQGPMQFLPSTWEEAGIGAGDINDPRDAINAAARYLVRRGGPGDMPGAIWGYNNSDEYVTAIESYAELLRQDPAAYHAIYNWEIYFFTEAGDVWLPTGLLNEERLDLDVFLSAHPWSLPDAGLR